ncbi:HNH endonuclease [Hoyosella altamirensis]|uniref:HNH endonuclease n=1 Tax=Hoyosella altamirensis TaxID=616997 RepID=UPI0007DAE9EC|nr:HNH endonuclease [Hoyosella altamirensis]
MAVSKRLRYEVLRRDNHCCRYCGAKAPDVKLTVDHVTPAALGGSDDPSNLVSACAPCNSGKSSSSPDAPLVADVDRMAIVWAKAIDQAAYERSLKRVWKSKAYAAVEQQWELLRPFRKPTMDLPTGWRSSVDQFLSAGLDPMDLAELVEVTFARGTNKPWQYFCGCCWRRVNQSRERASQLIEEWDAADSAGASNAS